MSDCKYIEGCIFFNDRMANMPSMADMYKKRYCKSDWRTCARFQVCEEVGREGTPKDLFPNEDDKVATLIAGGG